MWQAKWPAGNWKGAPMSDGWVAVGDDDDAELDLSADDPSAAGVDDGGVDDDEADGAEDLVLEAALAAARGEFGDFDSALAELIQPGEGEPGLPVLAVVGRPNVGKSTLVNRIIGRREAVVEDVPGVTRDRVTYEAEWNSKRFMVIDTGGWDLKVRGLQAQIAAQAERAVSDADAVVFVVDARVWAARQQQHAYRRSRTCAQDRCRIAAGGPDGDRASQPYFCGHLGCFRNCARCGFQRGRAHAIRAHCHAHAGSGKRNQPIAKTD